MIKLLKKLPVITLGLALFMNFFGCQSNSPLAPENSIGTVKKASSEITFLQSKVVQLQKSFSSNHLISSAQGGTMQLGDYNHGFSSITFPAGSLSEDLNVAFDWDSKKFEAEFGPHGSQFLAPVVIRLSYKDADLDEADIDEEDLKIWYYDETDGLWELAGQIVNTEEKYVEGTTTHFSRYALGGD